MNTKEKEIYSEVYGVLQTVGDDYTAKLPAELLDFIKKSCDENSVRKYDITKNINEQNISKEALAIITALNLMYFASDEDKQKINNILKQNEEKIKNAEITIKKHEAPKETLEEIKSPEKSASNELLIPIKLTTFKRVWNFIKKLFIKNK